MASDRDNQPCDCGTCQAIASSRAAASDRDTLVELVLPIDWSGGSAGSIADAVIGAGWRPSAREITDPDTPDTYPARTIGVDRDGEVWVSRFTDWVVAFDQGGTGERLSDIVADFGPLTIVYVPTEDPDCPHDSRSGADGRWWCDQCGGDCGPDAYLTEETTHGD